MRNVLVFLFLIFVSTNNDVLAHSCSSHAYLTHTDYIEEERNFADCDRHTLLKETTIYFYSNGTRRTQTYSTIFNKDGSILESGCSNVNHIIHNKKHYFTFYKNKKYKIMDENGNILTIKNYKKMEEVNKNRFLVKLDKKLGIIDIEENIIVPIKYKHFEKVGKDLFLTKLNGYYGMLNSSNNNLIKNEYEKIKPLYDTFLLKKYGKFGLADKNGKILFNAEYDKIEKLGEYITIKKNKKKAVLDSSGKMLSEMNYKDIRLNRNNLEGKIKGTNWQKILTE